MNDKLELIAKQAQTTLGALMREGASEILDAWKSCVEEAELQESHPKLRLGFTITANIDKNKVSYDLTFGVRRKLSAEGSIGDPNQQDLPIEDDKK